MSAQSSNFRWKKKRKRDAFDRDRELKKLVSAVMTIIRREGKVAKRNETQKLVKRVRQLRDQLDSLECDKISDNNHSAQATLQAHKDVSDEQTGPERVDLSKEISHKAGHKAQNKLRNLEYLLNKTKHFDITLLISLCMKRLGMKMLGVDIDDVVKKEKLRLSVMLEKRANLSLINSTKERDKDTSQKDTDDENHNKIDKYNSEETDAKVLEIAETLLAYKNVTLAMNTLDEKAAEYRREVMRQEGENIPRQQHARKEVQDSWSKKKTVKPPSNSQGQFGSLFVESLSGQLDSQNEVNHMVNPYGPAGDMDDEQIQKKNRMGQRARRARRLAEEAKRSGRTYESLNWRPKKAKLTEEDQGAESTKESKSAPTASGLTKQVAAAEVAEMGKSWKEEGKAHPSWAAKQQSKQQSGIAAFKGKKITFE